MSRTLATRTKGKKNVAVKLRKSSMTIEFSLATQLSVVTTGTLETER
jgi:hypothetical protein